MKPTFKTVVITCILTSSLALSARSILRPQDPNKPMLTAAWEQSEKTYSIESNYLEPYPLFTMKTDNLVDDLLPMGSITFHDGSGSVRGQELSYLMEELLSEIKAKKKNFTHFTVLQDKNYSFGYQCGLLVLKFNDYPFVLKLFLETPETFCNPYIKGAEPIFFWYMGGGAGRHVSGLTRVKNLKNMKKMTESHAYWHDHIIFPRKWFWLSNKTAWITLTGKNIKQGEILTNAIPGTFAVIADWIDTENSFHMTHKQEQDMVMNYCNTMGLAVDPHRKNYSFQKHPSKDEAVMVIVDTEHFPTMVGLKDPTEFKNHTQWYRFLVSKGFNDIYMRTKKDRSIAMAKEHKLALIEIA